MGFICCESEFQNNRDANEHGRNKVPDPQGNSMAVREQKDHPDLSGATPSSVAPFVLSGATPSSVAPPRLQWRAEAFRLVFLDVTGVGSGDGERAFLDTDFLVRLRTGKSGLESVMSTFSFSVSAAEVVLPETRKFRVAALFTHHKSRFENRYFVVRTKGN